jgi:hypothetical protein
VTKRIARNVLLPGERIPDDGQEWITVPKGNDRMWRVTLVTRRGRTITGTATVYRWYAIMMGVRKRWPNAVMHPKTAAVREQPLTIRRRVAGPVVITCTALDGPVVSRATKH